MPIPATLNGHGPTAVIERYLDRHGKQQLEELGRLERHVREVSVP